METRGFSTSLTSTINGNLNFISFPINYMKYIAYLLSPQKVVGKTTFGNKWEEAMQAPNTLQTQGSSNS